MKSDNFTIRVIADNPHSKRTLIWRVGQVVTGMEGCSVENIVRTLTALEMDTGNTGKGDPARWLAHFAGLESEQSGKNIEAWIEIIHNGSPVRDTAEFRGLFRSQNPNRPK